MHPVSTQHYWICTVHVLSACQSYSLYFHYDMKIWKVLNSEIHVISSCIVVQISLGVCASACARAHSLMARLIRLVRVSQSLLLVWFIASHIYEICVCVVVVVVPFCFHMHFHWQPSESARETAATAAVAFAYTTNYVVNCVALVLYSIKIVCDRHSAAYTTGVKNMRLNFSFSSFSFRLLSKQCCMFKMHAIRTKCLYLGNGTNLYDSISI